MKQLRVVPTLLMSFVLTLAGFAGSEQDKSVTKSFSLGKGGALVVAIRSGNIKVTGWEKDEVVVKATGLDTDDLADMEITQEGKTVRVRCQSSLGRSSDLRVTVNVPSRFDIDVETSGGDIELEGPLTGDLHGTTSGGDIRLGNLGGTLRMSTSGGDITAGKFQGDLSLSTSGGDINVGSISGQGEVVTSGGEIVIDDVGKSVRATTSGGDIKIGNVGGDAKVSTAGGDIKVGKVAGSISMSTAGGDVELRSATGSVSAKTAGGNLLLEDISGYVDGSTAGGNIDVRLNPGKNGKSKLTTAAGDIRLQVPENAKATINARIRLTGPEKNDHDAHELLSDFKIENLERDRHEIRGTVNLHGGGNIITVETMMGNIEIRKSK